MYYLVVSLEYFCKTPMYNFVEKWDFRNISCLKDILCFIADALTLWSRLAGMKGIENVLYLLYFSVDLTIRIHCDIYIMNWLYTCSFMSIYTLKFLALLPNIVFLNTHTQFCILLLIQKSLYNRAF